MFRIEKLKHIVQSRSHDLMKMSILNKIPRKRFRALQEITTPISQLLGILPHLILVFFYVKTPIGILKLSATTLDNF